MTREQEYIAPSALPLSNLLAEMMTEVYPELCERFTPEEVYAMLADGQIG